MRKEIALSPALRSAALCEHCQCGSRRDCSALSAVRLQRKEQVNQQEKSCLCEVCHLFGDFNPSADDAEEIHDALHGSSSRMPMPNYLKT
jgi:hypothetical protein